MGTQRGRKTSDLGDTQSFTGHSPEQPDLMWRLAPAGAGAGVGIPANLDCSLLLGFTGANSLLQLSCNFGDLFLS